MMGDEKGIARLRLSAAAWQWRLLYNAILYIIILSSGDDGAITQWTRSVRPPQKPLSTSISDLLARAPPHRPAPGPPRTGPTDLSGTERETVAARRKPGRKGFRSPFAVVVELILHFDVYAATERGYGVVSRARRRPRTHYVRTPEVFDLKLRRFDENELGRLSYLLSGLSGVLDVDQSLTVYAMTPIFLTIRNERI